MNEMSYRRRTAPERVSRSGRPGGRERLSWRPHDGRRPSLPGDGLAGHGAGRCGLSASFGHLRGRAGLAFRDRETRSVPGWLARTPVRVREGCRGR